ncbi:MAG: nitroreductase [Acidobacteriota bacterium]|nr:nitroreductase [Acidobacteriota bacterium]
MLLSRASNGALTAPGPDDRQLRRIFEAAMRAPDHGKLRPWRFYVVRGEGLTRLAGLFAASARRRDPQASEAQIDKERGKPLRSPVLIVVVAKIAEGHKIPEIEQVLSAGAAAMNILNAAHSLGFGAKWVTGSNCYDPRFRADFGLDPTDRLIGFIHVGTAQTQIAAERPDPSDFIVEW